LFFILLDYSNAASPESQDRSGN